MTDGVLTVLAKMLAAKAGNITVTNAKSLWDRMRVRSRAMAGDDLAAGASLNQLVRKELAKLAKSPRLPAELRNDAFRNWVQSEGAAESFVEVMLAKAGGIQSLAEQVCLELARTYEESTGETRRLAQGPINLVVSDLYGQLTATPSAAQALRLALEIRTSARVTALGTNVSLRSPATERLLLRTLSGHLLTVGRNSWRTPEYLAPLTLEQLDEDDKKPPQPTTREELLATLKAGGNLVLLGDGGVGKTTFLLELASECLDTNLRTPLFVDAAAWARAGGGVHDHIAGTPAAQVLGISAADVVRTSQGGQCVLLVNGWNEIPAEQKLNCREALLHLTTVAPALAVVVATRTAHDAASLSDVKRIAVRGLTWQGQSAVVRSALPPSTAEPLIEYLARDTRLRHAARSPLILHGLIARARKEVVSTSVSVFDLLASVVDSYEHEARRQLLLDESPIFGQHSRYLQELASRMNSARATNLRKTEALSAIGETAAQLAHLVGSSLRPPDILDALKRNHLLQVQDDLVRFAHQRFQEYFAAQLLLRTMSESSEPPPVLVEAVNEHAWAESLTLVAGRMALAGTADGRAMLVETAASCDVSYACDLAGLSGFKESDDAATHQRLVSEVNALACSDIERVRDLAVACKIASNLACFADDLWALFESGDREVRLRSHRRNGVPISLNQLGGGALARISEWPSEHRAEFVHEVAGNPDNYDFIVSAATSDPYTTVRTAAIAALFWHYPASSAAVNSWLGAPVEVQTTPELVSYVENELKEGFFAKEIRAALRAIGEEDLSDEARLRLALAFPADVGPGDIEQVLTRLKATDQRHEPESILAIARTYAPDRLLTLTHELAVSPRALPEWAGRMLLDEPPEQKARVFERAWSALQSGDVKRLSAEFIGPLASLAQTRRCVESWMQYHHSCIDRVDADHDYGRAVSDLIHHAPGDDLLGVVMELSSESTYDDAVELVSLLRRRLSRDGGERPQIKPWIPTHEQYNELFSRLLARFAGSSSSEDRLFTYLACVASHIDPSRYGEVLIEAVRRHLDAWTAYHEALAHWSSKPSGRRPNNPSLGNYIVSAVARWGIGALPPLLELLEHPSSIELVPNIVARVAGLPWSKTAKEVMLRSVGTDIADGSARRDAGRALKQPLAEYQETTDEAARKMARLVEIELDRQLSERRENPNWNARQAAYRMGRLINVAACIPSPAVVGSVTRALGSGLLDLYGFSSALRHLVRQGWTFSDEAVAGALESLVEHEAKLTWVDDSTKHALAECVQLLFLVESPSMLRHPLSHYLREWRKRSHDNQVIDGLGSIGNAAAWSALLTLGDELASNGRLPSDYVYSVMAALKPEHLDEFVQRIAGGALTTWKVNTWSAEQIAPRVADLVRSTPEQLPSLVRGCRQARSEAADVLIREVLALSGDSEALREELVLEALDAGRADSIRVIERMFWLHVPLGEGFSEVHPKACNAFRRGLYIRAKSEGHVAIAARAALASLECSRREGERPNDEPRHPDRLDGQAWTRVLASIPRTGRTIAVDTVVPS